MFLFNCYEKKARKIACEVSERECLHTSRVEMGDGVVRWLSKIMGQKHQNFSEIPQTIRIKFLLGPKNHKNHNTHKL